MLESLLVLEVNSSPLFLTIKYKLCYSNIQFVVVNAPNQNKSCLVISSTIGLVMSVTSPKNHD